MTAKDYDRKQTMLIKSMGIEKNRERHIDKGKRKTCVYVFLLFLLLLRRRRFSLSTNVSIGMSEGERQRKREARERTRGKKNERARENQTIDCVTHMIRVGSSKGCGNVGVAAVERATMTGSSDPDGVVNGNCLLHKFDDVSSLV
jgi:hypothetical protein